MGEQCLNNCDFNNNYLNLFNFLAYYCKLILLFTVVKQACFLPVWQVVMNVIYECLAFFFALPQQIVNSLSPMLELKTAPSSSAMMAFAACAATHVQRSCRNRVPAVFCMDHIQGDQRWPRWPKPYWALKKGKWKSPYTGKMVSYGGCFLYLCIETLQWHLKKNWPRRIVWQQGIVVALSAKQFLVLAFIYVCHWLATLHL